MVVGVDTYHDSAKKGRSVGAFIASMNQTLTRYYSNCGFQSSHEELQNNLCTFMLSMCSLLIPIPHVGVQGSKSGAQSVSWLEVVKGIPNQGVVSFVS